MYQCTPRRVLLEGLELHSFVKALSYQTINLNNLYADVL